MTDDKYITSLIEGCVQMKKDSQLKLYRHFYSYAMSICLRYAHNRESASEIVNNGFLKVFLKIEKYHPKLSFKAWLRRVFINAAVDYFHKYEKNEDVLLLKQNVTICDEVLDTVEFDVLLEIIQSLPTAYRMIFNLYVIEGFTHREISRKLDISVRASKSNLSKARQQIKSSLSQISDIQIKSKIYG